MDNDISKMEHILSILREKNKLMDNLMAFTKEMEKAIDANDLESLGKVLSMRQESMDKLDMFSEEIKEILSGEGKIFSDNIQSLLDPAVERIKLEDPLEIDIFETNKMAFVTLKKIIALDETINKRMKQGAPE